LKRRRKDETLKIVGDRIYLKLIFFGTALAGKTTALEWLFYHAIPDEMKMVKELRQVKTSFGQTLLFDFAPIEISQNIVTRMFSATGQDYYKGTRTKVLADSDGIFFVIDSQKNQLENNREILQELQKCRHEMEGLADAEMIVLYNKNDLPEVYPMEFLQTNLGLNHWQGFSTCALTGHNLEDALILMLRRLTARLQAQGFNVE
jgi:signal recognition particle receptor subunit beta